MSDTRFFQVCCKLVEVPLTTLALHPALVAHAACGYIDHQYQTLSISECRAIFTLQLVNFSDWFERKNKDRGLGNFCAQ